MSLYSTGNPIVDKVGQLSFTGNIIPQIWYRTIVKSNNKPNLRAILFLADIVYWYRPTEIRDEVTGRVIEVRKKFKKDLLQRSYQQLADFFGCSKGEAQSTIADLVKLGVIKCDFRTETRHGIRSNNIMYLNLNVDALYNLTYPDESEKNGVGTPEFRDRVVAEKGTDVFGNGDTNTKNTQDITTENIPSFLPEAEPQGSQSDGLNDEELEEVVFQEVWEAQEIPYRYVTDERKIEKAVHMLTDYDKLVAGYEKLDHISRNEFRHSAFLLLNEALIGMLTSQKPMKLNDTPITPAKALEKLRRYIKFQNGNCYLEDLIDTAICDFEKACTETTIKNHLRYMQSCIWNAMQVGNIGIQAIIKRDFG